MLRRGDQGFELGRSLVPAVCLRGWQAASLKPYQVSPALRASPWPAVPPVPSHARRSSSRISGEKTCQRRAKSVKGSSSNAVRTGRRPAHVRVPGTLRGTPHQGPLTAIASQGRHRLQPAAGCWTEPIQHQASCLCHSISCTAWRISCDCFL